MSRVVSLAVLHGQPPAVFVAEDAATLHRLLALEVVARDKPRDEAVADVIRAALLDERWGDAIEAWIAVSDDKLDVYDSWDLVEADDVELAMSELQFRPLFTER